MAALISIYRAMSQYIDFCNRPSKYRGLNKIRVLHYVLPNFSATFEQIKRMISAQWRALWKIFLGWCHLP